MRLPEFIRVGFADYKVRRRSKNWMFENNATGLCDSLSLSIDLVVEDIPEQSILETLWHEVSHAISDVADIDLTETQVRQSSPVWLQVIRDNPKFLILLIDYAARSNPDFARDLARWYEHGRFQDE